jgi:hypothetical protein
MDMTKVKVAFRDILLTRPRIMAITFPQREFLENNNDFATKSHLQIKSETGQRSSPSLTSTAF